LALKFLRKHLFQNTRDKYHSSGWIKELALYNLALNGMLTPPELETFFKEYGTLSMQSKAFLILAAAEIDYSSEKIAALLAELEPKIDPKRYDYHDSSSRETAVCLLAAVKAEALPEKQSNWAGALLKSLKPEGRWYSTADTGWCLLALSRFFKQNDPSQVKPIVCRVSVGNEKPKVVAISEASGETEIDPRLLIGGRGFKVESDTKRLVHYTLDLKYPDLVKEPSKLQQGFVIDKTIENLNGKKEIRVGDVLRIKLDIRIPRSTTGNKWGKVDYLALVDPVPAGLVPVNSDLKTEGVVKQAKSETDDWDSPQEFSPSFFELRDDGVRVFKNRAWTGVYKYSYLARAVAAGDFWMRGSRISLMYDPDVFGKTMGERIKILPAKGVKK
jgi:uncharacterized protein YfaS (alpha-2-macroglobulin family)